MCHENPPDENCKKGAVLGYNAPSNHWSSAAEHSLNSDMTKLKCCKNTRTGNFVSSMKEKSLSHFVTKQYNPIIYIFAQQYGVYSTHTADGKPGFSSLFSLRGYKPTSFISKATAPTFRLDTLYLVLSHPLKSRVEMLSYLI